MASCCTRPRCSCLVAAGDGVTIEGNGSASAPYVVSADAAPTALVVTDSPSVNLTLTGDGAPGSPYEVTATVTLDPVPPGGGDQLLQQGPDGLYLECEQVRGCISAGDGAAYDEETGVVSARPSTDAGNALSYGTDGGLLVVPPGDTDPTVVEGGDSETVTTAVAGDGTASAPYVLTSNVILDPSPPGGGDQLLQAGPDGLYLECEQVRGCVSAGDGAAYDEETGVISARLSADAGNTASIGSDGGIFTPPVDEPEPTALGVTDSTTVDLSISGTGTAADPYDITGAVVLDPAPPGGGDQLLQQGADGLYLECEQVRGCISAGDGAAYDEGTGVVSARPSADAGNSLSYGTDGGLLVPTPAALEVGCGLQGEGTEASPLRARPIGGQRAWATDWNCAAEAASTLRCDPNTGALWTPPEHSTGVLTVQQNHPLGGPAMPATGTTVIIDAAAWSEGVYDADSMSTCRGISFSAEFTGHADVSWTAGAIFDLAFAVSVNGGSAASRLMYSELTPSGPAGRRRTTFSASQAAVLAPHTGYRVRAYPAIRVTTGTVTINQWITDTHLLALTR
ncbi:hypothetical protein [Streptomyces sp. WL006]|uniref:hypothetical protein n=1 Tax=Streptomyces sp. WL006 TaxID=3423915 RepID=UPI003F6B6514